MHKWVLLGFTSEDHWQAGIGDPTVMGWVTVVAYFTAAFLCWSATLASKRNHRRSDTLFWLLFTCFLLVLGVNKQLDLQTWFTLFGNHLAQEEGWYGKRRAVQAAFILCITVVGMSALLLFWRLSRKRVRHYGLGLAGGVFLGCFIVVRAASFHYVDQMLGLTFNNVTVNCMLELGGISCVAVAAMLSWREGRLASVGLH